MLTVLGFSSKLLMGSQANFCLLEKDQPGMPSTRCPFCGKVRYVLVPPRGGEYPNILGSQEMTKRKQEVVQPSAPGRLGQAWLLCPQFAVDCSLALGYQGKGPPQAPGSDGSCWKVLGLGGRRLCR